MRNMGLVGLMLVAGSVTAGATRANLLTFDGAICNGGSTCAGNDLIDQSYGDYPGVDVQYSQNPGDHSNLSFWDKNYSNLTNVAFSSSNFFQDNFNIPFPNPGEIFLKPIPGNSITLNGFDLGSYSIDGNQTTTLTIMDGNNLILDSITSLLVDSESSYHYGTTWSSMSGIKIQFGPVDWGDVGIDNVDFTVSETTNVPEPASLILLGGALGGLCMLRCRRKTLRKAPR